MEQIIQLNQSNIAKEHICCGFSDVKCKEGYELKKRWLSNEFEKGYLFRRIDARAKVFIEYGPAESCWMPISAPNYLVIGCFWVSGQYKGHGYAKELLKQTIDDAIAQNKQGLATIVGTKKFHFMSDTKWLLKQGFEICESLPNGFSLLVKKLDASAHNPSFNSSVRECHIASNEGIVVYYSNRCPFTEFHVNTSLMESVAKRGIPTKVIKFDTMEQAQASPTPATIFSLFYNGKFVTTDLSVCMDSRFDKLVIR